MDEDLNELELELAQMQQMLMLICLENGEQFVSRATTEAADFRNKLLTVRMDDAGFYVSVKEEE